MSEQVWALCREDGYVVGQLELPEGAEPMAADSPTPFAFAQKKDRLGDLMIEDTDGAAGWVTHDVSDARSALFDQVARLDRVAFVEFLDARYVRRTPSDP